MVWCSTSKLQRTGGQGKLKVLVYRADIIIWQASCILPLRVSKSCEENFRRWCVLSSLMNKKDKNSFCFVLFRFFFIHIYKSFLDIWQVVQETQLFGFGMWTQKHLILLVKVLTHHWIFIPVTNVVEIFPYQSPSASYFNLMLIKVKNLLNSEVMMYGFSIINLFLIIIFEAIHTGFYI